MTMNFGPLLEQAAATPGIRSIFTAYHGELLNNPMCAELFDRESKCLAPSAIQMALDLISVEYVIRTINSKHKPPAQRYKDQMTKIMQVRPDSFKIARQLADSVMMRAGC